MKDKKKLFANYLSKYYLGFFETKNPSTQGFTLIELMVVFIIIGILAAVSIPALFGQIGKSKEAETLTTLGAIARTQQAHHFLYGKFALTLAEIEAESGKIAPKYHQIDDTTITGVAATRVKVQAIAFNPGKDQVRNYAIGVYFDNGAFNRATCQGEVVGDPAQVGDLASDPCQDGTKVN